MQLVRAIVRLFQTGFTGCALALFSERVDAWVSAQTTYGLGLSEIIALQVIMGLAGVLSWASLQTDRKVKAVKEQE